MRLSEIAQQFRPDFDRVEGELRPLEPNLIAL
jgi:hypothetical protein